ncbi:LPS export ABC transporter periplasmic protein LptC [Sneathiella limimaris]|uniref:LPS export ABC transporter periplasmic protein LptC n=1 Tax=Sneathiella limimaris TaxID=1964213 RepID=UPI00146B8759|nr:LPS export ABC transporter periplasmic protein LptC [Sneathiella limimaris]
MESPINSSKPQSEASDDSPLEPGEPTNSPHLEEIRRKAIQTGTHTRFVSVMKWVLPTLAVILIATAFILPGLQEESEKITLEYLEIAESDHKLTMTNPRFLSSDRGNQQFMVTADSATQQTGAERQIELINLQADITLSSGRWISIAAPKGWLDTEAEALDLVGGVEIFSDDGNQISAETARVLLSEKKVLSPKGLRSHGPLGELSADSFIANQLSGTLKFEGNVKMTLYP